MGVEAGSAGAPRRAEKITITPGEFQEMCDEAVLAAARQDWPADAVVYHIARAVLADIHERVCRHLGQSYDGGRDPQPANERRLEEIVELVSRHWSAPVMVEPAINGTVRMVLEHWRRRHNLATAGQDDWQRQV